MRMNPDGTKMERLVHGLRVPYSFDYDPFGQLWLLSNGEGNPDRFVRVLDGVDYHCYSRGGVDNEWLAGRQSAGPSLRGSPRRGPHATDALLRRRLPGRVSGQFVHLQLGPARFRRRQPRHLPFRPRRPQQRHQEGDAGHLHRSALPAQPYYSGSGRQPAHRRLVRPGRRKRHDGPHLALEVRG